MAQAKEVKSTFEVAGIPFASVDELRAGIFILVNFLQSKGLTKTRLVESIADIDDDFELRSPQLIEDGILFLRAGSNTRFIRAKLKNKLKSLERSYEGFKKFTDEQKMKLRI